MLNEEIPRRFDVVDWVMCVCMALAIGLTVLHIGGCSGNAKQDARTANDIADQACSLFATEQAEAAQKAGINIGDIADAASKACEAKDAARPFLDALLAAKREQEVEMGARMGIPAE